MDLDGEDYGIIPAYAGSTPAGRRPRQGHPDHPRIRGEHTPEDVNALQLGGSSPHTRGARVKSEGSDMGHRIIPAYAGSTSSYPTCELPRTDHPRIRGEHFRDATPEDVNARIIPAYAGSTGFSPSMSGAAEDHPRIRGEHSEPSRRGGPMSGSSPHTRGAPHSALSPLLDDRIIPAYAGSTSRLRVSPPLIKDHPRIRGEHGDRVLLRRLDEGSSPHTRGALDLKAR